MAYYNHALILSVCDIGGLEGITNATMGPLS